jgi:uncharacterized repeat protein (TIGR01451 family)
LVYVGSEIAVGSVSVDGSGKLLFWNIPLLGVNKTVTWNISVYIARTGNISNSVNVSSNESNIGENGTDGSGSGFTANKTVNLSITKVSNISESTLNGDLVKYTITVVNHGPDNGTDVVVVDVLDNRLLYISSNATKGIYDNNTSLWTIGDLSVGETVVLDIFVQLNGTGKIVNIAEVSGNEYNIGENGTDGSGSQFASIPKSVLVVNLSSNVSSYYNGDTVLYTIVVTNLGPDIAHSIRVEDVLQSKLIYVLNSASVNPIYSKDTNSLLWTFDTLNVGESLTIQFKAIINGTGKINNTVGVDCNENNQKGIDISDSHPITKNYLIKGVFSIDSSIHSTTIEIQDASGKYGKEIVITAVVKDESGNPATNKLIKVYIGGKYVCSGYTDANGKLTFKYTPKNPGKSDTYEILMVFDGDDYHGPANATGTLTVEAENKTNNTTEPGHAKMKHTGTSFNGISIALIALIALFVLTVVYRRRRDSKNP